MLNNLYKNLFYLRKKNGLTQEALTTALGFSSSTWSNYENAVSVPSLRDLERIAHYFGVTCGTLLEDDLMAANPDSEKYIKVRGRGQLYSVNEKLSYVAEDQPNFVMIWSEIKKLREEIDALKQLVDNK